MSAQEVPVATPTTNPPAPTPAAPATVPAPAPTPLAADKKNSHKDAVDRFKYGVIIRGKFIGVEDVKEDHGDEICRISMIKLKALVLAKKEHKQRICVKISLDGVEILDEKTNQPMFNHSVTKISYIARDIDDSRAIGYIYKNSNNSFQYFAIKTLGQAQELFNTLKELFEVVLEMRNKAKLQLQQQTSATETKPEEEAHKTEKTDEKKEKDPEIIGLEDKIKQMNEQPEPSLLDINADPNNLASSFEETLAKTGESTSPTSPTSPSASASSELFSLMDPNIEAPSPQDNAISALKNQISNLQMYSAPPRMPPGVPIQGPMLSQNPFGAPQVANPFGGFGAQPNMGAGMGVPLTHFQQTSPPIMNQQPGLIPINNPNVFSSQIPNPQAAVNPNPNTNQLPW